MVTTLNQVKIGSKVKLEAIPDDIRANLIRMGLCVGDLVKCIAKVPAGPVVLSKGMQELAIGQNFAQQITVKQEA